jgi:uncharacterized membrane-anchored protein
MKRTLTALLGLWSLAAGLAAMEVQRGPLEGKIGDVATVKVDQGYVFIPRGSAKEFMEKTGNIPSGNELGIFIDPDDKTGWFSIFEFEEVGYIKDPEKEKLDPDALLKSIKEGNDAANDERKRMGSDPIEIVGWHTPPFFNQKTKRLEWAILGRSKDGDVVNYKTRILGRKGVMSVVLVCGPQELDGALKAFTRVLDQYDFTSGNKYSEWKTGDKVAAIGLGALILGGIGAKTGLLGKLGKLLLAGLKFIWIAVVGLFAWLKNLFTGKSAGSSSTSKSASKAKAYEGDLSAPKPEPVSGASSKAQPTMDDPKT